MLFVRSLLRNCSIHSTSLKQHTQRTSLSKVRNPMESGGWGSGKQKLTFVKPQTTSNNNGVNANTNTNTNSNSNTNPTQQPQQKQKKNNNNNNNVTSTTSTTSTSSSKPQSKAGTNGKGGDNERFQKAMSTFADESSFQPITRGQFIDTHVHLDMIFTQAVLTFDDMDRINKRFFGKDFGGCINVNCYPGGFDACVELSNRFPWVFAAYGVHPHDANLWNDSVEAKLLEVMKNPKTVAWGECGLDFFKNRSPPELQKKVFARQCQLAVKLGKPLVVHTRDAEADTLEILKANVPKDHHIHIHCFTNSAKFALELCSIFPNAFFGFTGVITFKSADSIRDVVKQLPLERILLETDGPFMAVNEYRGTLAHPGQIPLVAKQISEVKGIAWEAVLTQARKNSQSMYGCFP